MICRLPILIDQYNIKVAESGGSERLTQRALSRKVGLSATTVNRLHQNDFSRIDTNTIEALCDFFGCELSDLLALRDEVEAHD